MCLVGQALCTRAGNAGMRPSKGCTNRVLLDGDTAISGAHGARSQTQAPHRSVGSIQLHPSRIRRVGPFRNWGATSKPNIDNPPLHKISFYSVRTGGQLVLSVKSLCTSSVSCTYWYEGAGAQRVSASGRKVRRLDRPVPRPRRQRCHAGETSVSS